MITLTIFIHLTKILMFFVKIAANDAIIETRGVPVGTPLKIILLSQQPLLHIPQLSHRADNPDMPSSRNRQESAYQ